MAVDEQSRHELYTQAREALGDAAASTLMDYLPPVGWADVATKQDLAQLGHATKQDLAHLEESLTTRIDGLDERLTTRIDGLDERLTTRMDGVEERLTTRIDGFEERLTLRMDGVEERLTLGMESLEHKVIKESRGELIQAVTAQTRTILFATVGTILSTGSLAFAAARLGG